MLARGQRHGLAERPEHVDDTIAFGGLPLVKPRSRRRDPDLDPLVRPCRWPP